MQMLKKIFNSDKKYYLELDEIKESKPVQAVVETAEKVTDVVRDKASEVLESEPAKETVETAKKTQDVAQNKLKSTTKTKSKPKAKSKGDSKQSDKNGRATKSEENTQAMPSPQDAGASPDEPPFWVAAMYNKNNTTDVNSDGQKAEQTFATDNLMPTITRYRRRPGASLSKFKDMASKVKTPKG